MAYEKMPSPELMDILEIKDDKEQYNKLVEYVSFLEDRVRLLEATNNKIEELTKLGVVEKIMKTPIFKEWLEGHDATIKSLEYHYYNDDWSGVK